MLTYWDNEEIFIDGDLYFDRLLADIDTAKEYITIEMYMFNDDSLGSKITESLIRANQRGVKIQVIVDGVGSYHFYRKLHGTLKKLKIYIKVYNPLPFYHPFFGKISLFRRLGLWGRRLVKLNKRDHRKIITIDYSLMYLGSYNFTSEHTSFHLQKPWKDMGVRVSGVNVKFAVLNFKRVWKLRDYYKYKSKVSEISKIHWKTSPLRLNQNIIRRRFYTKDLFTKIKEAKEKIWIITPYFIPGRKLILALGQASKRGVDVQVLISHHTDIIMFNTLQFFYYPYLLKKGVKVFHYNDTVLHAKNFIIDDWVTVGTSNLNHRSFLHDLEADLVIEDEQNIAFINEHFQKSTKNQTIITQDILNQRTFLDILLARIFFLFKYWF